MDVALYGRLPAGEVEHSDDVAHVVFTRGSVWMGGEGSGE